MLKLMERKGENGTTMNMQMSSKGYKEYRRMISIINTVKLIVPYCDEKQEKNEFIFISLDTQKKGTSRDKSKG